MSQGVRMQTHYRVSVCSHHRVSVCSHHQVSVHIGSLYVHIWSLYVHIIGSLHLSRKQLVNP